MSARLAGLGSHHKSCVGGVAPPPCWCMCTYLRTNMHGKLNNLISLPWNMLHLYKEIGKKSANCDVVYSDRFVTWEIWCMFGETLPPQNDFHATYRTFLSLQVWRIWNTCYHLSISGHSNSFDQHHIKRILLCTWSQIKFTLNSFIRLLVFFYIKCP